MRKNSRKTKQCQWKGWPGSEAVLILILVSVLVLISGCVGPGAATRRGEPKEKPHIFNATWDQTFDASIVVLEKMWYGVITKDREKGMIQGGFKDALGTKVKEMYVYLARVDDAHTSVRIDLSMDLGFLGLATRSYEIKRFYRELAKQLER